MIDDQMDSGVVVYGPPGTEPVMRSSPRILLQNNDSDFISKGRFDSMHSVVYSRISSGASLSSGHTPSRTQLLSIPSKDIPLVRAEVYATLAPLSRGIR